MLETYLTNSINDEVIMNHAVILLGSNIDKEDNLTAAVRMLRNSTHVLAVSPVYETMPVGLREQPSFLNVAVLISTELDPAGLKKHVLTPIEVALKRTRKADKNAPRTIDADLVLFNDEVLDWNGRHLPDPDLLRFPHVAVPVAALAPGRRHPETGEQLHTLAARLLRENAITGKDSPPLWPRPDMDRRLAEEAA